MLGPASQGFQQNERPASCVCHAGVHSEVEFPRREGVPSLLEETARDGCLGVKVLEQIFSLLLDREDLYLIFNRKGLERCFYWTLRLRPAVDEKILAATITCLLL